MLQRYSRHPAFDPVNCAGADAEGLGRFEDARAGRQLLLDALHNGIGDRSTPQPFPLAPRPRKTRFDPLDNHRALELGKHTEHLKQRLSGWRAGVEPLLVQVDIDALGVQFPEERDHLL